MPANIFSCKENHYLNFVIIILQCSLFPQDLRKIKNKTKIWGKFCLLAISHELMFTLCFLFFTEKKISYLIDSFPLRFFALKRKVRTLSNEHFIKNQFYIILVKN
ncbi:hypothetical protein BpHYR1_013628 [Brachionus plicatilis]|uniref:Uncharacterized protein n=1 Tax=Brachionus plicatilis TaxID=10195 RepID=A0A3M7P550_BRAPC|nr:hypothetical protein BpHYR1_013628 [Brachionus plicatilis]